MLLAFVLVRGHENAGTVAILLTGVVALAWAVMPLFVPSGDETLDPSRLVMLLLLPRPLVRALLVASLVGIGPVLTLFLAFGAALSVAHGVAGTVAAVLAVPLVTVTCVALSRAVAAANIRLLTSRKGRDLALLSGLVIAVGMQVVNFAAQRLTRPGGMDTVEPAAAVVGWLPPAAAIGAVDAAGEGAYAVAAARLLLTAAALAGLVHWWRRSLVRLMVEPDGSTIGAAPEGAPGEGRRHGPARPDPAGRAHGHGHGARPAVHVAGPEDEGGVGDLARRRSDRAAVQRAPGRGLDLLGVLLLLHARHADVQPVRAGHVGVLDGRADRLDAGRRVRRAAGRAFALLAVTLPFTLVVTVLTAAVLGDWGLSRRGSAWRSGCSARCWGRARWPRPSSPLDPAGQRLQERGAGAGGPGLDLDLRRRAGVGALCAPLIGAAVYLHLTGQHALLWLLLPAGALYGAFLTWAGLRLAAPRTANRLPEILAAVSKG